MGDIGIAGETSQDADTDDKMGQQVSTTTTMTTTTTSDSQPRSVKQAESDLGKNSSSVCANSPLEGTSLKCLPERRKAKPLDQPKDAPTSQSKPTSQPSIHSKLSSNAPSTIKRYPSAPPDYEMDGPHGGHNAALWRTRYVHKFEKFAADMSTEERTAAFDHLMGTHADIFYHVLCAFYWKHPDQIPERDTSAPRDTKEAVEKDEQFWQGDEDPKLRYKQQGCFGAAWTSLNSKQSPFDGPVISREVELGPKNETNPLEIEDHTCAYCTLQNVKGNVKEMLHLRRRKNSNPFKSMLESLVKLGKRKSSNKEQGNVEGAAVARTTKVAKMSMNVSETSLRENAPDGNDTTRSGSRLFKLLRRSWSGGSRQQTNRMMEDVKSTAIAA